VSVDVSRPLVYLVTPGECDVRNFAEASARLEETAKVAVDAGVDLIQIREKRLSGKLLFDLTRRLADIVKPSRTKLLVNDRFDIAVTAGADGVHLTSSSMPGNVVRRHVPDGFIIGRSIHNGDDLMNADGADFVLFGPVFPTPGKGAGVGLTALADACRTCPAPVIAIGGINEANCREVLSAGAAGFAAIRALSDTDTMRRILNALER
jgi:thiamine-phosphate pyrophosphorylase